MLISALPERDFYIYIFFSIKNYHRTLNIVPCATQVGTCCLLNAFSFDIFELEGNKPQRKDYPSLFQKIKQCSGNEL